MKKNIFINTVAALAAAVLFNGCSLKEDSTAIVSPYNFFQTEEQIRAAINGCYDPLNSIHDFRYFIAVEGATDLASTNGSAQRDAKFNFNPASPASGTHVWQNSWYGIRYCLSTIAGIHRSPLDDATKAPYEAETLILESYYWYILTSFFGDVPFYQDYVETDEDMVRIAKLGRMSAVETRNTLIKQLLTWVPVLPQVRTYEVEKHRIGAAMGWMMIAKLAAWNKDWDNVINACNHLEEMYGDLSQYPYSDVMFRNKNTPESIFEIQHAWEKGGVDYVAKYSLGVSALVLPYPKTAGTAIYCDVTIDEVGPDAYCYTPLRPTSYMKSVIAPSGKGDIRRDYNMVSSWNGKSFKSGTTWMGPKFWCPNVYQNYDSNNYKIFRYADALLLLAEAWCEVGNYQLSVDYLNKVRSRAHIEPYSFYGEIKLRGEIRDERARELFGEFGRKYDLVRWGIWYDQVVAYNLYNLVQQNVRPCHRYYPIPDVQCARSGRALSNPEYEKYNLND